MYNPLKCCNEDRNGIRNTCRELSDLLKVIRLRKAELGLPQYRNPGLVLLHAHHEPVVSITFPSEAVQ